MAYTMLDPPAGSWGFEEDSFEARALAFLRESCEGLRFDRKKDYLERKTGRRAACFSAKA